MLNADTVTTLVGDSLSIITHRHSKSFNIKYKSSDKLRQRTIDSEFMLSYIKAGAFSYDRISIPFDRKGANFSDYSVEAEENDLQYLKKLYSCSIFSTAKRYRFEVINWQRLE